MFFNYDFYLPECKSFFFFLQNPKTDRYELKKAFILAYTGDMYCFPSKIQIQIMLIIISISDTLIKIT